MAFRAKYNMTERPIVKVADEVWQLHGAIWLYVGIMVLARAFNADARFSGSMQVLNEIMKELSCRKFLNDGLS